MRKNLFIFSTIFLVLALSIPGEASARPVEDGFGAAKTIETKKFTVQIASGIDEGALTQSLDIGPSDKILAGQSLAGASFSSSSLGDLLDALFIWAGNILDMQLYSFRGTIKIARNSADLDAVYQKLYGQLGRTQKAFYVYEVNTLYLSAEDFTKEIIGHEMAHAIISNFFVVQPPTKVAEVLAGYIEFQIRKK
jgi:hypothetical protein